MSKPNTAPPGATPLPYAERTPATESIFIVRETVGLFCKLYPRRSAEYFLRHHVEGQAVVQSLAALVKAANTKQDRPDWLLRMMVMTCGYTVEVQRAFERGEPESDRWAYVAQARHYLGWTTAMVDVATKPEVLARLAAARGGAAAHKDDRQMKAQIRAWCDEWRDGYTDTGGNRHTSLNALARAAAKAKLNATKQSTIRDWLKQWAKEWRAAGNWPNLA